MPQSARICAIGGVKLQFGQCPNIHGFFWGWGFPKGDLLPAALDSDLKLKAKFPFQEFPAATGGPDCPVKTVSLVCLKNCEILKS